MIPEQRHIAYYLPNIASKGGEENDEIRIQEKNHPPSRWKARIEAMGLQKRRRSLMYRD